MSAFSADEVSFLRGRGNAWAAKVWTGLCDDAKARVAALASDEAVKDFIVDKYEKKRWDKNEDYSADLISQKVYRIFPVGVYRFSRDVLEYLAF